MSLFRAEPNPFSTLLPSRGPVSCSFCSVEFLLRCPARFLKIVPFDLEASDPSWSSIKTYLFKFSWIILSIFGMSGYCFTLAWLLNPFYEARGIVLSPLPCTRWPVDCSALLELNVFWFSSSTGSDVNGSGNARLLVGPSFDL